MKLKVFKSKLVKDTYVDTFWDFLQDEIQEKFSNLLLGPLKLSCRKYNKECMITLEDDGKTIFSMQIGRAVQFYIANKLNDNLNFTFYFDKASFPLYLRSGELVNNILKIRNAEMLLLQYIKEIDSARNYKFKEK